MSQSSDPEAVPVYPAVNYLNADRGVWSWFSTLDHKRIGLMYLMTALFFFLVGGIFAMAIRLELLTPGPTVMGANTYNRMFTLHGVVMIFLFMIPAIPGVFGNFLLPLMLGAKDVAFPRLNLLSLYLYWTGALLAVGAMVMGGTDTGWTFYAPYSTSTPTTVFPALLGVFILGFSSILTGLNFIVTIHTLRAPGLGWMRLQLFLWAIYATSIIQVLATPVIGLTVFWSASSGWGASGSSTRPRAVTPSSSSTCSGSTPTRPFTSWCCRRWASSATPSPPSRARTSLATR